MIKKFLNPKGHQNPFSGSKVTAILLKGWIWPIGGASAGEGLPCSLRSKLVCVVAPVAGQAGEAGGVVTSASTLSRERGKGQEVRRTEGKEDMRTGGHEDRRTGGQEDRRTGKQEDRRTGGQEDRRTGGQEDRRTREQEERRTGGQYSV